ncbi:MAG TPA: hypothetical protein VH394_04990 [Thermoanaerobaculia bacterium]|jgi:hypothetical protein|nr:hypothetical protein [Thermoanaerobaculia bacterium]
MPAIRIRRLIAVLLLAVASMILPLTDLHAAPRHESRGERPDRIVARVLRDNPVVRFLRTLWEEAGARIDDNG